MSTGIYKGQSLFDNKDENMAHTILRTKDVMAKTKLSRTSLYEKVRENAFPKPIPLGGRAVGWTESEVDTWIESLMRARELNPVGESVGEKAF